MTLLTEESRAVAGTRESRAGLRASLHALTAAFTPPRSVRHRYRRQLELMAALNPSPMLPRLAEIGDELAKILKNGDVFRHIGITLGRIRADSALAFVIAFCGQPRLGPNPDDQALLRAGSGAGPHCARPRLALLRVIWFGLSLATSVSAMRAGSRRRLP